MKKVIYIYDTLCGWCNIARPEIEKFLEHINGKTEFEAYHRQLFVGTRVPIIDEKFLEMVRNVGNVKGPAITGVKISERYYNMIQEKGFSHNSENSSIVASIVKKLTGSTKSVEYAHLLQKLIFDYGMNPNKKEVIDEVSRISLLNVSKINSLVDDSSIRELVDHDKNKAVEIQKRMNIQGVPCLLIEDNEKLVKLDPYNYKNMIDVYNAIL